MNTGYKVRSRALMTALLLSWIAASTTPIGVCAQTAGVDINQLGDLRLSFENSTPVDQVAGAALGAEVRYRSGEAFSMLLPMTAQRMEYVVAAGSSVAAGTPIVRLSGPDVQHWLTESDAIEAQYEAAKVRYDSNLALFSAGSLSAAKWSSVQQHYYALSLERGHRAHVLEHAVVVEKAGQHHGGVALELLAPEAGTVSFDSRLRSADVDAVLFEIIPENALRLVAQVPRRRAEQLVSLSEDNCSLSIDWVEGASSGFFLTAWSAPLENKCRLPVGSTLSVTPSYSIRAHRVPRAAVFQWRQSPHVFIRRAEKLLATPVVLIDDLPDGFVITSDVFSRNMPVLVQSVSAVQGILLGLGES